MAAFLRQIKIRVLSLTSRKSNEKSRFTEPQTLKVLQSQQEGKKVAENCRVFGISEQTFYNWKSKYGGMTPRVSAGEGAGVRKCPPQAYRRRPANFDRYLERDYLKKLVTPYQKERCMAIPLAHLCNRPGLRFGWQW